MSPPEGGKVWTWRDCVIGGSWALGLPGFGMKAMGWDRVWDVGRGKDVP